MSLIARLLAIVLLPAIVGCGTGTSAGPDAPRPSRARPLVMTVNYPLEYFASRLAGTDFDVRFPAPPDVDPAYWVPDAATIAEFQQADLILLNGAGYAGWTDRVTLPPQRLVNTTARVTDRYLKIQSSVTHRHGPEGEHAHAGLAFTTWLDPDIALAQAEAIAAAFEARRPEAASRIRERLESLRRDLDQWNDQLRAAIGAGEEEPVLFSHPVYDYLIRACRLKARSLHWEPDSMPDDTQWAELDKIRSEFPARWMVWESEPDPAIRRRLEQAGVQSAVFSPCANRPPGADWMSVMRTNAANLATVFAD